MSIPKGGVRPSGGSARDESLNLCDQCVNCFGSCVAEGVQFGSGADNDNVIYCNSFDGAVVNLSDPGKVEKVKKYVILKEIPIKPGSVFSEGPNGRNYGYGYIEADFGLTDNSHGVVGYYFDPDDPALRHTFLDVTDIEINTVAKIQIDGPNYDVIITDVDDTRHYWIKTDDGFKYDGFDGPCGTTLTPKRVVEDGDSYAAECRNDECGWCGILEGDWTCPECGGETEPQQIDPE